MTHTAEVVDVREITPRVKGFRLRVPDHGFEFEPGQHTAVRSGSGDETAVFGKTREETTVRRETLNELAANHANLDVTITLSDPNWAWTDRAGCVKNHLQGLFGDTEAREFYTCGVPPVVVDTKTKLRDLGTPAEHIHSEGCEGEVVDDS